MNVGQAAKAKSRSGVTSQPPRGAISTQQRSGETQAESRGGITGYPPKAGQVVDPRADLVGQRTAFKTEFPHLAEGGTDQTELQLKGNAAVA
jgi:hypothetical protein